MKDRHGSVVVNMIGGESLPAFFFQDEDAQFVKGKTSALASSGEPSAWGGQELLQRLEQVIEVVGSAIEPGVYLVNASHADKINHGAATPPLDQSPVVQDHPLCQQDTGIEAIGASKRPYTETIPAQPLHVITPAIGRQSPDDDTKVVSTSTGPITVEGMRRRRSLTESSRGRGAKVGHGQSASTGTSPQVGTPNSGTSNIFTGRPRTPLPFENQLDPIVNVRLSLT
jgi:hypothetical protein